MHVPGSFHYLGYSSCGLNKWLIVPSLISGRYLGMSTSLMYEPVSGGRGGEEISLGKQCCSNMSDRWTLFPKLYVTRTQRLMTVVYSSPSPPVETYLHLQGVLHFLLHLQAEDMVMGIEGVSPTVLCLCHQYYDVCR